MKILLVAYACEPNQGSEDGNGWHWARQIALRNHCVLITRKNNVRAIEAALRKEKSVCLTIIGFDLPRWARFWKRGPKGTMLYFYLWQIGVSFVARRAHRSHSFDLSHHITFASSLIPSGLVFLKVPFIWGPVGQHPRIPKVFLKGSPAKTRLAESARAHVKWILAHWDPFLWATLRRAKKILSLGSEFEEHSPRLDFSKVIRMPACGVSRLQARKDAALSTNKILFSGRLVELKGPELALSAFSQCHSKFPKTRMTFLGDGPLKRKLQTAAKELGIEDSVNFLGKLPHDQALREMGQADIFLFPSFEGAGVVIPEAMASRATVLCLRFGGPGDMVGQERGLAVPVRASREQTARELARGLESLLRDSNLNCALQDCAADWIAQEMLWDRKGDLIQEIYQDVLLESRGPGSQKQ